MAYKGQFPDILGFTWEESKVILDQERINYHLLYTSPPGHESIDKTRRVIRTRWREEELEIVLADEKFPQEQIRK